MECYNLKVYGIVQGVGFRFNLQKKANKLGLCGTVRNLPNGSVEIEVVSPKDQINHLISWIESDPGSAKVEKIELLSYQTSKKFDEFSILY